VALIASLDTANTDQNGHKERSIYYLINKANSANLIDFIRVFFRIMSQIMFS